MAQRVHLCLNSILTLFTLKTSKRLITNCIYSQNTVRNNPKIYLGFLARKNTLLFTRQSFSLSAEGRHHDIREKYVMAGLRRELMPKHVAIILDGNRRWLKANGKPLDYNPFFRVNMLFANLCLKWGVSTATSYVYGLETLGRDKEANNLIFGQLHKWLTDNLEVFIRKRIRVSIIGERSVLDERLQSTIKEVEEATRNDSFGLELILAVCYEGRNDIVQATRNLCMKVKASQIQLEEVDEAMIDRHLSTSTIRNPDLLIRTGGDLFLSNFLMWQLARTELYFTSIYGPEFTEAEFIKALISYQKREKAFDK